MSRKRDVLALLTRPELLAALDRFELQVEDRRVKDGLTEALARSKKAGLDEILEPLSRKRLKELCRELGLDDGGREKAVLVERLAGGAAESVAAPASAPTAPTTGRASRKKNGAGSAELGFEAKLWQAADRLRNNMDAAEYKHIVLGLIFLKYISDAFEERRAQLLKEAAEGADPEDPDEYRGADLLGPEGSALVEAPGRRQAAQHREAHRRRDGRDRADNPTLKGVLPKDFARPALDKQRLGELIDLVGTIGLGDSENRSKDILGTSPSSCSASS